jgi:hypothetical protein
VSFAYGKYALAICSRCGQRCDYTALRTEWQGLRVCEECYEPKHPQLGPFKVPKEPQALYKPGPEAAEPVDVPVGENVVFPPWYNGPLQLITQLGTVKVTINGVE